MVKRANSHRLPSRVNAHSAVCLASSIWARFLHLGEAELVRMLSRIIAEAALAGHGPLGRTSPPPPSPR
jgi:hypothetical protein